MGVFTKLHTSYNVCEHIEEGGSLLQLQQTCYYSWGIPPLDTPPYCDPILLDTSVGYIPLISLLISHILPFKFLVHPNQFPIIFLQFPDALFTYIWVIYMVHVDLNIPASWFAYGWSIHVNLLGGMEHFIFSHTLGRIIQFDFHIFRIETSTTNQ